MNTTQATRGHRTGTHVGLRVTGRTTAAGVVVGQASQGGDADHPYGSPVTNQRNASGSQLVMKTVAANELRPGDTIIHRGKPHPIDHVHRGAGWAWPVASDGAGWAIALGDVVAILDHAA